MNHTFKTLTLTAALFSFAISAQASAEEQGNVPPELVSASLTSLEGIQAAGETKNETATGALLSNVESYLAASRAKGPYEDNLKARLKAINSIWALGEIGSPQVMTHLEKFYAESDDVIKMNLLVSMGKLAANPYAAPYLRAVASDAGAAGYVRAAAFEMLEELGQDFTAAGLVPSAADGIESGDLIYTGGIIGNIGSWFSPD
ncbi:MAG TPA: hypothetical protein PKI19_05965, partial [Elusimicrobiales bacterium]|nr:hypothetical protein [Elusimicrobiales bacterium]